jgi:hypothetical protein
MSGKMSYGDQSSLGEPLHHQALGQERGDHAPQPVVEAHVAQLDGRGRNGVRAGLLADDGSPGASYGWTTCLELDGAQGALPVLNASRA